MKVLDPDGFTSGWSMHRLVQEERATIVLAAMFPRIEDSRTDPNLAQDATIESLLPCLRVAGQYDTNRSLKNHERNEGDWEFAVPWLEQAHRLSEEVFGPSHPDTILRKRRLGNIYNLTERHKKALELIKDVVEVYDKMYGPDSESSPVARNELAQINKALGVETEEPPLSRDEMRQLDIGNKDVPISLLLRAETRALACMTGAHDPSALAEADALLIKVANSFTTRGGHRQSRVVDLERLLEDFLLPFFKAAYVPSHEKTIALGTDLVFAKHLLRDGEGAALVLTEIKEVVNLQPSRLVKFKEWTQDYEQKLSDDATMAQNLTAEQKKTAQAYMRELYARPEFRHWIAQRTHSSEKHVTLEDLEEIERKVMGDRERLGERTKKV
ncbi:hypothetical protein AC578_3133 [Pseudocercospora eumusae]|uniref:Uncharacterized protein n=1 Tax=Pseudocercospora eumusae TaxID=321146 RepID=A0A139H6D2_9PEZI|nr:hypothetical protein AC578_3133 [Pseudocercospora eumusae]